MKKTIEIEFLWEDIGDPGKITESHLYSVPDCEGERLKAAAIYFNGNKYYYIVYQREDNITGEEDNLDSAKYLAEKIIGIPKPNTKEAPTAPLKIERSHGHIISIGDMKAEYDEDERDYCRSYLTITEKQARIMACCLLMKYCIEQRQRCDQMDSSSAWFIWRDVHTLEKKIFKYIDTETWVL